MSIERVSVEDSSQVAPARTMAVQAARNAGMAEQTVDVVALVATELSENLHRHAVGGELLAVAAAGIGGERLALIALDRGPGVRHFDRCLVDGYSTGGTMGTGLGAVRRLADDFDSISEVGRGTVVSAGFGRADPARVGTAPFDVAAIGFPIDGEDRNGDAYAVARCGSRLLVLLADGLGHGVLAAEASECAAEALADLAEHRPAAIVAAVSDRIGGTRGAAVSVASLGVDDARSGGTVDTAGLGNVSLLTVRPDGLTKRIVTAHGTAGVRRRSPVPEQLNDFAADGLLVLHSDGLTSRWTLEGRADLLRHRSEVIAAALWRDHARATDDSLVVVIRAAPTPDVTHRD